MNMRAASGRKQPGRTGTRNLLSLREASILAGVPERRVRKDLETGLLDEPHVIRVGDVRLAFEFPHIVLLAAVYGSGKLSGQMRKRALLKLNEVSRPDVRFDDEASDCVRAIERCRSVWRENPHVYIDGCLFLDMGRVLLNVLPSMEIYCNGLARSEERDDILGGQAVFLGTRLSVAHVGKMSVAGEPLVNILDDYPYLSADDVKFAELYHCAHPAIGRPRATGEDSHAEVIAG